MAMETEKPSLTSRSTTKTNKCISKSALHKTKAGKCQRPSGNLHRNPYLNFLREFRQRHSDLSAVETIRRGAKEWQTMEKEDKLQYIEEAFYAPKKKRKPPPPPKPLPVPMQQAKMRRISYPEDCGIVCPRMGGGGCGKKRRKKSRKAKCGRKRRPKKRSCGKKRRKRSSGCKKKKKRRCPI